MDCEKFESVMIDELYGELDEVTSAAAKRHLSGCSRCASLLAGLRATRRIASLPMVEPPPDLEAKILAATWEAQKVVPIRSRVSRALAWAGNFAMRPQTAMAAVFLLMIGSSVLLLQSKRSAELATPQSAYNAFKGGGYPASAPDEQQEKSRERVDLATAASAHGVAAGAPMATATALPARDEAPGQVALGGAGFGSSAADDSLAKDKKEDMPARKAAGEEELGRNKPSTVANAAPPAGAPAATGTSAGPMGQGLAEGKQAQSSDLDRGLGSYRAGRYDEATKTLDSVAPSDPNAALWAARSVRDGTGCAAAVPRFDELSTKQWGTTVGYEATMDAGRCYRSLGRSDVARARFSSLLQVPAYMAKAQEELDQMTPKAVTKPAPRAVDQSKK